MFSRTYWDYWVCDFGAFGLGAGVFYQARKWAFIWGSRTGTDRIHLQSRLFTFCKLIYRYISGTTHYLTCNTPGALKYDLKSLFTTAQVLQTRQTI